MAEFTPRNPEFARRVRSSFARQGFMAYLGADLRSVEPGACEIRLPYRDELSQQHRYFHGGVIGTLADNAGGYAAFTLMGEDDSVLTVEFKLNIVAPGEGEFLLARGRVVKSGRTLTVCRSDVFGVAGGVETLCGTAQVTLMRLADRPDGPADSGEGAVAEFTPPNPDYAEAVRQSFALQGIMATIGARLGDLRPGYCEVHLPFADGLTQQDGYFHGGMIAAIGDSAAGYAAFTLAPPEVRVLTVEYKFNFMAPGDGERLVARAQVIKAGRTLAVCHSDVFVFKGRAETQCAASLQTLIYIDAPPGAAA